MLSAYGKVLALIQLIWPLYQILASNIQIEDFHAHSFVPKEIILEYSIYNGDAINFNLSVRNQFPGKLLMHIFVRQLDNEPGGHYSNELMKLKNMDFCKTLESLRNVTSEQVQGDSILPQTFLISCPLKPGFYYIRNGKFDVRILPIGIPNGRYLVQFELIQVYEEVIKLLSCRIRGKKYIPIEINENEERVTFSWSDEDEEEDKVQENINKNEILNKTEIIPTKTSIEDQRNDTEVNVEVASDELENDDEKTKEEDEQKEPEIEEQESDSKMEYY